MSDWLVIGPDVLALLFFVAMLAGCIDAIAGGGGMIVVPVLLATGISPAQVLATNKLQSVGGSFSASLYFMRRNMIDLSQQKFVICCTCVGAVCGAILIQHLRADILQLMLPLLIIIIGVYFYLVPTLGKSDRHQHLSAFSFGLITGLGIGFYDGFFGPGTGSFYALAYVTLYGYNLAKATAHAKLLNFISNLTALLFFIIAGQVIWLIGLVMLVGQVIGARIGANLVLTRGQTLIRPMIISVSLIMSCKLLYDNHSIQVLQWLGF